MSDFFGRIVNLVKGAAENLLNDLEKDNPEAVLTSSMDVMHKRIAELDGIAAAQTRRIEQSRRELERLEMDRDNLQEEAAQLAKEEDNTRALEVVEGKQRLEERLVVLRDELNLQQDQLQETQKNRAELEQALKRLKKEKDKLLTDHHLLGAQAERAALAQGAPQSAAFQAIQSVKDQLDRAEGALARAGASAVETASQRRARAQAELETLKRGSKETPAASDAQSSASGPVSRTLDAAPHSAPEPTDTADNPLPKRSL